MFSADISNFDQIAQGTLQFHSPPQRPLFNAEHVAAKAAACETEREAQVALFSFRKPVLSESLCRRECCSLQKVKVFWKLEPDLRPRSLHFDSIRG